MKLGQGTTTSEIAVTGTVAASGGAAAALSTGILIDMGASVPTIRNSGAIRAAAAGTDGSAYAIFDRSGTVKTVENSGAIAATGGASSRNVALDLSANTNGATVKQSAPASGAAASSIAGDIRFGSGNNVFEIAAGTVKGDVGFNAGADTLALSGASSYEGNADFGGGQDRLTLAGRAILSGKLINARGLAVSVAGGTFAVTGPAAIGSLALGEAAILSIGIDKANPTASLIDVAGATTIAKGAQLAVRVTGGQDIAGHYVVLRSGTLTGADNLTLSDTFVPFIYQGTLTKTVPNEIAVDVVRRAKTEFGFNKAQFNAFDAIDVAIGADAKVAAAVRGIYGGKEFRAAVDQLLPNYAGGVFESVTLGSRAVAAQTAEPAGRFSEEGKWGFWLAPVGWDSAKATRDTIRYDVSGRGIGSGIEHKTGAGNFGLSFAYLTGHTSEGVATNRVGYDQLELAGTWRGHWGGFAAQARLSAAQLSFDSKRFFDGVVGSEKVHKETRADWNGRLYSAAGSVSYEHQFGSLSVRPIAALDYYRLDEDAYRESGGGKAIDLTVAKRSGDELAATASLAAGINFGGRHRYGQWSRVELEAGRRAVIAGALGATTANFADGKPFTIDPESRGGGWVGKIRAITGTTEVRLSAEGGAEQRLGNVALSARAALQFAF